MDLVIKQLMDSEVSEAHAKEIIDELTVKDDKQPIDNILANVYQKIVLKLGEIQPLTAGEKKPKVVFLSEIPALERQPRWQSWRRSVRWI